MALDDNQIQSLAESNRRLAIVGLFNRDQKGKVFTFSSSGEGGGRLTAASLFEVLQPQLFSQRQGKLIYDTYRFNKYLPMTPLESLGKEGANGQLIRTDSPLLRKSEPPGTADGGAVQRMAAQGADLFERLVTQLDIVAPFSASGFAASLHDLAREYVLVAADNQGGDEKIDRPQWTEAFNGSHRLASACVKYLLCYPQDEPAVRGEMARLLATETKLSPTARDLAEAGLVECRETLRRQDFSPVLREISQWVDWKWLLDFGSDPDRGFAHRKVPAKGSFMQYYNVLTQASDEIHRLVRTEALHPMIVLWLASKYLPGETLDNYNLGTKAAPEMFRLGVVGQGDKRAPALPAEVLRELGEDISGARPRMEQQLNEAQSERLKSGLDSVEAEVYRSLIGSRRLTPEKLGERALELFKKAAERAGGTVGTILGRVSGDLERFHPLLRALLNVDDDTALSQEKIALKLDEHAPRLELDGEEIAEMRAKVHEAMSAAGATRWSPARGLVQYMALRGKTRFASEFGKLLSESDKEAAELEELYRFRTGEDVMAKGATPGQALVVIHELADFKETAQKKRRGFIASQLQQAAKAEAGGASIKSAIPNKVRTRQGEEKEFPEGSGTFDIQSGGSKVGELVRTDKGEQLELRVLDLDALDGVTSAAAKVKLADGEEYPLMELNLENLDQLRVEKQERDRKLQSAEDLADHYARLGEVMDKLVAVYSEDKNDELGNEVRRDFRAMLLAEHILAAPRGTSTLGMDDLSGALALLVDAVEHLGRPGEDTFLRTGASREQYPTLERALKKINLSAYFPVASENELATVLDYFKGLGQQIGSPQVKGYLDEVRELRDLFKLLELSYVPGLEILIVNDDLASYAPRQRADVATIYLTGQAARDGALTGAVNKLAEGIGFAVQVPDLYPVVPVLFAENGEVGEACLPLITAADLHLRFVAGAGGGLALPVAEVAPAEPAEKTPGLSAANLPVALATALAPLLSLDVLGRIDKVEPADITDFNRAKLSVPPANENVVKILRQLWNSDRLPLVEAYLFARWLTMAFHEKSDPWSWGLFGRQFGETVEARYQELSQGQRARVFALLDAQWQAASPRAGADEGNKLLPVASVGDKSITNRFGAQRIGDFPPLEFSVGWKSRLYNLWSQGGTL